MNATKKIQTAKPADLQLAFDVGHSSIGWAVLANRNKNWKSRAAAAWFFVPMIVWPVRAAPIAGNVGISAPPAAHCADENAC